MIITTKAAHTPGPWQITNYNASMWTEPNSSDDWVPVISVAPSDDTHSFVAYVDGSQDLNSGEAEANARLIAAAPEMLEALESVRERLRGMQEDPLLDKVHTAIQKARGQS